MTNMCFEYKIEYEDNTIIYLNIYPSPEDFKIQVVELQSLINLYLNTYFISTCKLNS